MKIDISEVALLCEQLNSSNSSLDKIEVLKTKPNLKVLLEAVYNVGRLKFGVTSDNIKKMRGSLDLSGIPSVPDLLTLLETLASKGVSGHYAISLVLKHIEENPKYEELIYNAVDRNLKCRIGIAQLNIAFPGLISKFGVALGCSIEDYDADRTTISFTEEQWYISRKLDGNRCLIFINEDETVDIKSRSGKDILTLDVLKNEVKRLKLPVSVYDGEICIVDENGDENFQAIMSEIRKKNHTIDRPMFCCFDMLTHDEFFSGVSTRKLDERQVVLNDTIPDKLSPYIKVLPQIPVTSWDQVDDFMKEAKANGWEGAILRKNDIYQGKRSNDILKVKQWFDNEYTVNSVDIGPFQYIAYDENHKSYSVIENLVTSLNITHKGTSVGVGSGPSLAQRKEWTADQSQIVNKVVTIKYFEETQNQNGQWSLRFPILKTVHGDKRVF